MSGRRSVVKGCFEAVGSASGAVACLRPAADAEGMSPLALMIRPHRLFAPSFAPAPRIGAGRYSGQSKPGPLVHSSLDRRPGWPIASAAKTRHRTASFRSGCDRPTTVMLAALVISLQDDAATLLASATAVRWNFVFDRLALEHPARRIGRKASLCQLSAMAQRRAGAHRRNLCAQSRGVARRL